ncbi:MAG TPA: aminotransferase class V-fold PLP-dependent enzyme [Candidatus Limnocylindrales bacterium]|nr:aminotransferase class V-fold PLP-dependent enzyme [Candidatus Limnocylindrales bacterium]
MRELLEQLTAWQAEGLALGRAVVVRTFGSAPREAGAVLIGTDDGRLAGSVSGGCVEGAAFEEIRQAREAGRSWVIRYGISDEQAWDVGLACGGTIDVLIEPQVRPQLTQAAASQEGRAVLTLLPADAPPPEFGPSARGQGAAPGEAIVVDAQGLALDPSGATVPPALAAYARQRVAEGTSGTLRLDDGRQWFVEAFGARRRLVIVGAVQVAIPLVSLAATLGYETVVVDGREAFIHRERFPHADRLVVGWPDEVADEIGLGPADAVAVLSHDVKFDEPAIVTALRRGCRYVGAVGSRKTQADRRARLLAAGLSEAELGRLRGPVGLDLGGRAPAETALAIMAQVVAERYGASGGPLRAKPPAGPEGLTGPLLRQTAELAVAFREGLAERRVGVAPEVTPTSLRRGLDVPLPEGRTPPEQVVAELARAAEPGIVASAGPRYYGFVVGGGLPAALAADWLTSTWDQNAGLYVLSPAAAIVEDVAGRWLLDVLGLPAGSSVGFTTGATTANLTAVAAARHALLHDAGWNVADDGLQDAPRMEVVVGEHVHASMLLALRMAGFGRARLHRIPADAEGRMQAPQLAAVLAGLEGPVLVAAQAGDVNSGAFDPLAEIAALVKARPGTWLHVDGAFGLWAAADPTRRHLLAGIEEADSWATDAHKWLNVPYDAGLVFVRDPAAHLAAMSISAAYLVPAPGTERDPFEYVPEMSRRARGFPIYAALRSLGRAGLAELVERSCTLARRMAEALAAAPGVEILNEVVLDQVLVRFGDDDELTRAVIAAVQEEGTSWLGGTTWRGRAAMRISIVGWSTSEADVDRSAAAILACLDAARLAPARLDVAR